MITWATVIALATGAFSSISDSSSVLFDLAELAGVIALFTLVCMAEAFSTPKS